MRKTELFSELRIDLWRLLSVARITEINKKIMSVLLQTETKRTEQNDRGLVLLEKAKYEILTKRNSEYDGRSFL